MKAATLIVSGVVAAIFTVATPPFQTPDEVGHYWRAVSLARGEGTTSALVPRGVRDLVAVLWVPTAGRPELKVGIDRIRAAASIPLQPDSLVRVHFPAQYTPVPQLPTILACFIGMALRAPPLLTFYLARACNAATLIALIFASARRHEILAVVLLPMTLYLAGSFSPDAVTIGLACYATALVLTPSNPRLLIVVALLLALCKPVYFLIPLAAKLDWRRRALLLAVILLGVTLAGLTARRNYFPMRTDVVTDPVTQLRFVEEHPLHFLGIVARDDAQHATQYADHLVGHLGWLDIQLPKPLVALVFLLLIAVGCTSDPLPLRTRITIWSIAIVTCTVISLSQYLAWTPLRAGVIEGMQGRYFLPVAPLVLSSLGIAPRWRRPAFVAFALAAVALDAVAIAFVIQRYY